MNFKTILYRIVRVLLVTKSMLHEHMCNFFIPIIFFNENLHFKTKWVIFFSNLDKLMISVIFLLKRSLIDILLIIDSWIYFNCLDMYVKYEYLLKSTVYIGVSILEHFVRSPDSSWKINKPFANRVDIIRGREQLFGGWDQFPIPTRYKISVWGGPVPPPHVKFPAWGDQPPPSPPPTPTCGGYSIAFFISSILSSVQVVFNLKNSCSPMSRFSTIFFFQSCRDSKVKCRVSFWTHTALLTSAGSPEQFTEANEQNSAQSTSECQRRMHHR